MAGWGGKRVKAGRPYSGAKTDTIAKLLRKRAAEDPEGKLTELPLDFLIRVMRDNDQPIGLRVDCAKSAAPYVHAKLQSIDIHSEEDRTLKIEFLNFTKHLVETQIVETTPLPSPQDVPLALIPAFESSAASKAIINAILDDDPEENN